MAPKKKPVDPLGLSDDAPIIENVKEPEAPEAPSEPALDEPVEAPAPPALAGIGDKIRTEKGVEGLVTSAFGYGIVSLADGVVCKPGTYEVL